MRSIRIATICAILLTQLGVTPMKQTYDPNLYVHAQRVIDVGGRRMNIVCVGSGSPTVILDAGLGGGAAAWARVQTRAARQTRVCAYDRAGMGFSDPAAAPRDAAAIVRDLRALLRGAKVVPPYVLVGHSSGGIFVRLYADRYPNEVVGLVLVDPDSEYENDADRKIVPALPQLTRANNKQIEDCALNVSEGKCPFFPSLPEYQQKLRAAGCPQIAWWSCAVAEVVAEQRMRPAFWHDMAFETEALDQSYAEIRAAQRSYGNLPLIVLKDSEDGDIDYGPGPISVAQQRKMWQIGVQLDEDTARLSSVGAVFVVAGSTHMIPSEHPTAVISAIAEVVDQARVTCCSH
jgi:pimeloyl-ACP methyl ester carboxylesterase